MFHARNYRAACTSFRKAGNESRALFCEAADLKVEAGRVEGTWPQEASRKFMQAGGLFLKLNRIDEAGRCFRQAGEYFRAGTLLYSLDSNVIIMSYVHNQRLTFLNFHIFISMLLYASSVRSCWIKDCAYTTI